MDAQSSTLKPSDPNFNSMWAMQTWHDSDLDVPYAWSTLVKHAPQTPGDQLIVAVVDSGIDYNHPDLRERMWKNPGEIPGNGIDDDGNGYIDDVYGIFNR